MTDIQEQHFPERMSIQIGDRYIEVYIDPHFYQITDDNHMVDDNVLFVRYRSVERAMEEEVPILPLIDDDFK